MWGMPDQSTLGHLATVVMSPSHIHRGNVRVIADASARLVAAIRYAALPHITADQRFYLPEWYVVTYPVIHRKLAIRNKGAALP